MKVLHIVKTADGAAWAFRQVSALRSLGVDVEVVLPGEGTMATAYAASGVRTHFLQTDLARLRSPAAFARARRGFAAICEDVQPDIIHSHFVGTTLFLRLAFPRGNGALRVFQVAGPLHLENAMTRAADLMTARDCDYWIATCKATRDIYRDVGVPPDRVGLTYLGMDIGKFTAVPPSLSRESLNLPPTTRLVGLIAYYYAPKRWLGYRRGIKGHEDLIEATGILRDKGLDVAAVFAGGPWPRNTARDPSRSRPRAATDAA